MWQERVDWEMDPILRNQCNVDRWSVNLCIARPTHALHTIKYSKLAFCITSDVNMEMAKMTNLCISKWIWVSNPCLSHSVFFGFLFPFFEKLHTFQASLKLDSRWNIGTNPREAVLNSRVDIPGNQRDQYYVWRKCLW